MGVRPSASGRSTKTAWLASSCFSMRTLPLTAARCRGPRGVRCRVVKKSVGANEHRRQWSEEGVLRSGDCSGTRGEREEEEGERSEEARIQGNEEKGAEEKVCEKVQLCVTAFFFSLSLLSFSSSAGSSPMRIYPRPLAGTHAGQPSDEKERRTGEETKTTNRQGRRCAAARASRRSVLRQRPSAVCAQVRCRRVNSGGEEGEKERERGREREKKCKGGGYSVGR